MSKTKLAKKAVEEFVKNGKVLEVPDECPGELINNRKGVFVTLKKERELRGCMGTVEPTRNSIAKEIISTAVSACRDPRFPPLSEKELSKLSYEVYVLSPLELFKKIKPEDDLEEEINSLNPEKYGVMIKSGNKSALLLPGLEGLTTPFEQVNAALKKGGVDPEREEFEVYKFEAEKYVEK